MAEHPFSKVARQLLRSIAPQSGEDDFGLLDRFAEADDEEAFETLLKRHGPMVWRTCQRVVRQPADAEDAFQATFLVLCRKARSIGKRKSLAGWLHGVACRVALKAKARRAFCSLDESHLSALDTDPAAAFAQSELRSVLDEALQRLPEKYRVPVVLCYLEGKTRVQAAAELGLAEGTLSSRLAHGKEVLRARLLRRGVAPSAGALAALLAQEGSARAVPWTLVQATLKAKSLFQLVGTAEAGRLATHVLFLAEGTMKAMLMTKIKIAVVVMLSVSVLSVGTGLLTYHALAEKQAAQGQAEELKPPALVAEQPRPAKTTEARTDRYGDPLPEGAVARLGTIRLRHGGFVNSVAFSPDGKVLGSGGSDQTIRFWNVATGRELARFDFADHHHVVNSIAVSPDGLTVAVGCNDKSIDLRDIATGTERHHLQGHQAAVLAVAFSPDGRTLASGSRDRSIRLWDRATGMELRRLQGHQGWVKSLSFAPDGRTLASGGQDKTIRFWEVASGKELRQCAEQMDSVLSVAFSPDGQTLASGGQGKVIRLWDVTTGKELRQYKGHAAGVAAVAFSPDGKTLASGSWDATVRLWDMATGRQRHLLLGHQDAAVSVAFSSDGKTLASGGYDNTVRVWEVATGVERRLSGGHEGRVDCVAFSPDRRLLATGGFDHKVRLWEAATGKELQVLEFYPDQDTSQLGMKRWVSSVTFSPDGQNVAAACFDRIRVWEVAAGKNLREFGGHRGWVFALAFFPDGKMLASGGKDKTLRLWDTATGKELRQLQGHPDELFSLAVSPDGQSLAAVSGGRVYLWAVPTGKMLREFGRELGEFSRIAFSPDGKFLAGTHRDQSLRVWDVATGREEHQILLGPDAHAYSLAFSRDGRTLASGEDKWIRLWEVATGGERGRLQGHQGAVWSVKYSRDGLLLGSGSWDTTAVVWEATGLTNKLRKSGPPSHEQLDGWLAALENGDASQAYEAVCGLATWPQQTVPCLKQQLKPTVAAEPRHLARLITELDSNRFTVRAQATQELAKVGEQARAPLQKALAGNPSVEASGRMRQLLERLDGPKRLWAVRVVEVLEHIGTPEARQLLDSVAKGPPEARLTQEAKASLERLAKRPAIRP